MIKSHRLKVSYLWCVDERLFDLISFYNKLPSQSGGTVKTKCHKSPTIFASYWEIFEKSASLFNWETSLNWITWRKKLWRVLILTTTWLWPRLFWSPFYFDLHIILAINRFRPSADFDHDLILTLILTSIHLAN